MELGERVPFSFEAEQSVLGAVISEPSVLDSVIAVLKSSDNFYMEQHKRIYDVMLSMHLYNKPIDYVTLLNEVMAAGIFNENDGKRYLLQLVEIVPSVENVENYAKIVADKAILRQLMQAADSIKEKSAEQAEESGVILEYAEQRIYDIANGRTNTGFYSLSEGFTDALDRYDRMAREGGEDLLGIPTHYGELDRMLGGLHKSDLIILAARPGIGKSSLALNISENVALKSGKTVAFFSLEMSRDQLIDRVISSQAAIENTKLRVGDLNYEDWQRIAEAGKFLTGCNILFDDTSDITVSQMKAKLRRVKDVGLVVIDYLQLMNSGRRIENRVQEVSEMTRSLKLMAKEMNVPVICLSQLARRADAGSDRPPRLSDLRESGSIEQDADSVVFLFDEYKQKGDAEKQNIYQVIVGKNRHGETGSVELEWCGKYTRFFSLDRRHHA